MCCKCRRLISLDEFTVADGKDYHDHCYLESVRSRITILDGKVQRGTATILDAKELDDLRFLDDVVKKDIENRSGKFNLTGTDHLVFKSNTPRGLHSVMNPPKRVLEKLIELRRLKFGGWKELLPSEEKQPILESEPVFKIMTDDSGHKYCLQIGIKPIEIKKEFKGVNKYKNLDIIKQQVLHKTHTTPSLQRLPKNVNRVV